MFFYQALRGDSPKFSVDKGFLKGYAVPGALYPSVPISQSKDKAQEGGRAITWTMSFGQLFRWYRRECSYEKGGGRKTQGQGNRIRALRFYDTVSSSVKTPVQEDS